MTDILYIKKTKKNKVEGSEADINGDQNSTNDEGSIRFEIAEDTHESELKPEYCGVVSKVRTIIGKFTGSHVQNDYLQDLVREALGHELSLAKDMKTRWSSLIVMLEKFLNIMPQIRIAWLMSENSWPLDSEEIEKLNKLVFGNEAIRSGSC